MGGCHPKTAMDCGSLELTWHLLEIQPTKCCFLLSARGKVTRHSLHTCRKTQKLSTTHLLFETAGVTIEMQESYTGWDCICQSAKSHSQSTPEWNLISVLQESNCGKTEIRIDSQMRGFCLPGNQSINHKSVHKTVHAP